MSTQLPAKSDTVSDSQTKLRLRSSLKYAWIGVLDISVGLVVAFSAYVLLGTFGTSIIFYAIAAAAAAALIVANAMFWNANFARKKEARNLTHLLPWGGDEKVLEVGFGNSYYSIEAVSQVTRGDVSTSELWHIPVGAKRDTKQMEINVSTEEVKSAEADSDRPEPLPYKDGTFDAVLSTVSMPRSWKGSQQKIVMEEMSRVMKPGGWIGLLVLRNQQEIANALAESKFKDIEIGKAKSFFLSSPALVVARKKTNAEPITL
ncbi:MAG: class I SAM-dependent methyltransferase [Nitrososphaerota archaeon]|nr:class I SAM-dependent methyltransferase [Nitrososphaerota archaeon]